MISHGQRSKVTHIRLRVERLFVRRTSVFLLVDNVAEPLSKQIFPSSGGRCGGPDVSQVKGAHLGGPVRTRSLHSIIHEPCGGGGRRPESEEQSASVHTLLRIW